MRKELIETENDSDLARRMIDEAVMTKTKFWGEIIEMTKPDDDVRSYRMDKRGFVIEGTLPVKLWINTNASVSEQDIL